MCLKFSIGLSKLWVLVGWRPQFHPQRSFKKKKIQSWGCSPVEVWPPPIILAFGRRRQKDQEFKASLGYIAISKKNLLTLHTLLMTDCRYLFNISPFKLFDLCKKIQVNTRRTLLSKPFSHLKLAIYNQLCWVANIVAAGHSGGPACVPFTAGSRGRYLQFSLKRHFPSKKNGQGFRDLWVGYR